MFYQFMDFLRIEPPTLVLVTLFYIVWDIILFYFTAVLLIGSHLLLISHFVIMLFVMIAK